MTSGPNKGFWCHERDLTTLLRVAKHQNGQGACTISQPKIRYICREGVLCIIYGVNIHTLSSPCPAPKGGLIIDLKQNLCYLRDITHSSIKSFPVDFFSCTRLSIIFISELGWTLLCSLYCHSKCKGQVLISMVVNFVKFTNKKNKKHSGPSNRKDSGKLESHPGPKLGDLEI